MFRPRKGKLTDFGQPHDDDEGREGEEEPHLGPPPVGHVDAVRGLLLDVNGAGGRRGGVLLVPVVAVRGVPGKRNTTPQVRSGCPPN